MLSKSRFVSAIKTKHIYAGFQELKAVSPDSFLNQEPGELIRNG
jgi:hypothetical protein